MTRWLYLFQFTYSYTIIWDTTIAVRRPREDDKNKRRHEVEIEGPNGEYIQEVNADGYPVCAGNRLMKYVRTDSERGHLFRCATGGCQLNLGETLFPLYCEGKIWVKPEGKMLRIVGKIPRFSKQWKLLYKLRPAIERYFSSAKRVNGGAIMCLSHKSEGFLPCRMSGRSESGRIADAPSRDEPRAGLVIAADS